MKFDVAVVGAGLAGSLCATMLGNAGYTVALIDPHEVYPRDFRCEKIESSHLAALRRTGAAEALLSVATPMENLWVARFGRLLDIQPFDQCGFRYEEMVNSFRRITPSQVTWVRDKVTGILQGDGIRRVQLRGGDSLVARLVIMANGLNRVLGRSLGIEREVTHPRHSICIGFDMRPIGATDFAFRALQYNAELGSERVGYLSLFSIGKTMRANLFVYHDLHSAVINGFRSDPVNQLKALLPRLKPLIGDFAIDQPVGIRPTDLETPCYQTLPGVAMIGDACFVPCPASGKGALKAIVDAERLAHVYAPRWLASGADISATDVGEFYRDELKMATDTETYDLALELRERALGNGLRWEADRWSRFLQRWCRGRARRLMGQKAALETEEMAAARAR
jgi:2-polyprenyl-6-methoxyphenol hydroxylase-like FAD-dependent oxidoreductase